MSDDQILLVLSEVRSLSGVIVGLRTDIQEVRTDIQELRTETRELRAKTQELRAELLDLLGALARRMDLLEARVNTLGEELTSVRVEVMSRIDRLQALVEATREDVVVNFAQAERAERLARSVREEMRNGGEEVKLLTDQVTAMQRVLLRVNTRLDHIEQRQQ